MTDLSIEYILFSILTNSIVMWITMTTIPRIKFTPKTFITFVLCLILCSILSLCNLIYPSVIILVIIIGIFTSNHLIGMILASISYVICVVYNYIALTLWQYIAGVTQAHLMSSMINQTCFYLFFFPTLYLILRGIRWIIDKFPRPDKLSHKTLGISLLILLLVCSAILVANFTYEQSKGYPAELMSSNLKLFILLFALMAILITIIIIMVYKDARTNIELNELEHLKQYTEEVENMYTSLRRFKHDYANILFSMKHYIETAQYKELNTYYDTQVIPLVTSLDASSPALELLSNMKVPELKSILYFKIMEASKQNISTTLEVKWSVERINLKSIDLTRMVGILLDNAIEETVLITDPSKRLISISCIQKDTGVTIIISNPSEKEHINLADIRKDGYSTKGNNHGLGLSNINEILKKNDNIYLSTSFVDQVFTQTLDIDD
ncbi:MAG: sensor histidine kinase [Lachnospiraceae bacterium]|nr:sensor histidine kinase [Lachnospiraceae bacterium]